MKFFTKIAKCAIAQGIEQLTAIAAALTLPSLAAAQVPQPPVSAPQNIVDIGQLLNAVSLCNLVNWAFWFFIVLCIVFTLLAAFKYLTAAGDPERVRAAGISLIYVAVAIAVALIAKGFPLIISSLIGGGLTNTGC